MAFEYYNPKSSEATSPFLAGLSEAVRKLSDTLELNATAETNVALTEVFINEQNRYRIFECTGTKKGWLSSPDVVIKKNGVIITETADNFEINYLGGSIEFNETGVATITDSDVFTADVSFVNGFSQILLNFSNSLSELQSKTNSYKGFYNTVEELENDVDVPQKGDFALILSNINTFYIYSEDLKEWKPSGGDTSNLVTNEVFNTEMAKKQNISQKSNLTQSDIQTGVNLLDNYDYSVQGQVENFRIISVTGNGSIQFTASDNVNFILPSGINWSGDIPIFKQGLIYVIVYNNNILMSNSDNTNKTEYKESSELTTGIDLNDKTDYIVSGQVETFTINSVTGEGSIQFTAGERTTFVLPSSVNWSGGIPTFQQGNIYTVIYSNNLFLTNSENKNVKSYISSFDLSTGINLLDRTDYIVTGLVSNLSILSVTGEGSIQFTADDNIVVILPENTSWSGGIPFFQSGYIYTIVYYNSVFVSNAYDFDSKRLDEIGNAKKIQNINVEEQTPLNNQVLAFDEFSNSFKPTYPKLTVSDAQPFDLLYPLQDGTPYVVRFGELNEKGKIIGDINGDGNVNATDVTLLSRDYLNLENPTKEQLELADFNCDGIIDERDLSLLVDFVAKQTQPTILLNNSIVPLSVVTGESTYIIFAEGNILITAEKNNIGRKYIITMYPDDGSTYNNTNSITNSGIVSEATNGGDYSFIYIKKNVATFDTTKSYKANYIII